MSLARRWTERFTAAMRRLGVRRESDPARRDPKLNLPPRGQTGPAPRRFHLLAGSLRQRLGAAGRGVRSLSPSTLAGAAVATLLVSAGVLAAVLPYHHAAAPGDSLAQVVPASGLVGCPGMAGFDAAAMTSGSATAEEADTPAAVVLRQELYYSGLPQRGWRLVVDSPTEKWYGVRTPGGLGFAEAGVKLGLGVWVPGEFGPCEARAVPPAGYSTSTWAFASSPDGSSVDLYLRVRPQPCGGSPDQTAVAVSLEADSAAVVVTAYLRTTGTPSERICTGAGDPVTVRVHLPEPLGDRTVADGGPWPAEPRFDRGGIVTTVEPD